MKINKVIFSTSERFSVFWNTNARIWKSFGIEPVCLLFGKKENTDMTEEHGKIIEMPIINDIPLLIQITWSKFYWPIREPDTTWLIGDIDLFPLQSQHFIENISRIPDDHYAHLDCDGITQLSGCKSWIGASRGNLGQDLGHFTNLVGHYHCAKGKTLKEALEQNGIYEEELKHFINSKHLYDNNRQFRDSDPIEQHGLWCAEETRSTKAIRRSIDRGIINFTGLSLKNGIKDHGDLAGDRIDRTMYDEARGEYIYDHNKLINGKYVDLHCIRPFSHVSEEFRARRWEANFKILKLANIL